MTDQDFMRQQFEIANKALGKMPRWRVIEHVHAFLIFCERDRSHICITFGSDKYNIPLYGTREQAKVDADTICAALNLRDGRA